MPARDETRETEAGWDAIEDPEGRFSSGIPDFDRILGGGFPRGTMAVFSIDESVGLEDLDLLTTPTCLNFLYQSRGIVAVLPSRDSPHLFRSRLTRFATRRRFDTRVRVIDYVGEDRGPAYVVNLANEDGDPIKQTLALKKVVAAEREAKGQRKKPIIEYFAFEVFDTLLGSEKALKLYYHGIKRVRTLGHLGLGILAPGVGCAPGIRRMVDMEFAVRREDIGVIVRGVRPGFPSFVVTEDTRAGAPHVGFVPRPP